MRVLVLLACLTSTASASASVEDGWLDQLTARVIDDLAAGMPLVVETHVPLCDNSIIACGNKKLGDGDNPDTNLYWATTPGFGEWFTHRADTGWSRVLHRRGAATGNANVVAIDVYRRTVAAPAAWVKRGAPKRFAIDIVVHGWRGKAIDAALAAYATDVSGGPARDLVLDDGSAVHAGGAAQLVAWVGHNRLMDLDAFAWPRPGVKVIGMIAIACETAAYMEREVSAATRVPLLMTRDLLFSNAAPLEATVLAFAGGTGYATMRADAVTAYAGVQNEPAKRLHGVFTNPSDKRWNGKSNP